MEELISRIVVGMSYGSVYALLAVGLVLTYKTSGVFNLAYGAQAFVSGAIYYDLRVRHEWPIPFALLIAVFIVAPLLGYILDRGLFRYLRNAPAIAKLVTFIASSAALLILRRRENAAPAGFRAPGGAVLSVVAVALCVWLLANSGWRELRDVAVAAGVGFVVYLASKPKRAGYSEGFTASNG